jgi:hypothetical protein
MLKKLFTARTILILAVVGLGYLAWTQPEQIPYQPLKSQVLGLKTMESTASANTIMLDTPKLIQSAQQLVSSMSKSIKIPTSITGLPEEIVVDETVKKLGEQLITLPNSQIQQVRIQFCQDLIDNATQSASASAGN